MPSPRSEPGTGPATRLPDPAVTVRDLVIRYGDLVAVDHLSFDARAGEVTVVLGPNGAGKTSTIEHLEGYRRADAGTARVLGLDPLRDHGALSRRVGIMLQSGGIQTAIRPVELLRQYSGFFPDPRPVDELVDRVRLTERARTPFRRLSGGEQQRLSLALALIGRPEVVFLDEPTSGVDLEGRDAVRDVVDELRREGCCVVLSTHDLDEAERLADHVVIIDHGRAVAEGRPEDLVRAADTDHLLFRAPPGIDTEALRAAVGGPAAEVRPGEYRLDLPPSPSNVAAVTAWLARHDLPLGDLRAGRQRLDDVFRRLTADDASGGPRDRTDRGGDR